MSENIIKINKVKDGAIFEVDSKVYPLEVIKNTCFAFSDKYFFFIKEKDKDNIVVEAQIKEGESPEAIIGGFYNELLYNSLRKIVSKNNKKIRELITARALYSAIGNVEETECLSKDQVDVSDPLGIMTPWEEKYAKE